MSETVLLGNFRARKYEVDLVVDTSIYAADELLSAPVAITLVPTGLPVSGEIVGITLLDKDDEAPLLDLVILDASVSLGTINGPVTVSDADAQQIVATVPVTSYRDVGGCRVATPSFDPIPFESATGVIYIAAINGGGTPTFSAANDLRVKLMVRLHNVNK